MSRFSASIVAMAMVWALFSGSMVRAADPAAFLPEGGGWEPLGPPRTAGDEAVLFALIDGGAEMYVPHGFGAAAFRTYRAGDGKRYNVEIIEMTTPEAAQTVYGRRAGQGGEALDVGESGFVESYYLIFRKGPFYVTVTALDPASPNLAEMVERAKTIEKNLDNP